MDLVIHDDRFPIDASQLLSEIASYLSAIESFRIAGYEPSWRPEPLSIVATEWIVTTREPRTVRGRQPGRPRFTV